MAKDPAVLFYTQDFLVGSSMLTPLQKGHYITLLCHQQQSATGSLKVDEIKVLMGRDFDKQWSVLRAKFEVDGNGFYNKRMRIETEKRKAYSESRRKNKLKDPKLSGSYDGTYDEHMEIRNQKEEIREGGVGETKTVCWVDLLKIDPTMKQKFHRMGYPEKEYSDACTDFDIDATLKQHPNFEEYRKHFSNWISFYHKRIDTKNKVKSTKEYTATEPSNGVGTRLKTI